MPFDLGGMEERKRKYGLGPTDIKTIRQARESVLRLYAIGDWRAGYDIAIINADRQRLRELELEREYLKRYDRLLEQPKKKSWLRRVFRRATTAA